MKRLPTSAADTQRLKDGFREWINQTFPEYSDPRSPFYIMANAAWNAGTVLALDIVLERIKSQIID